MTVTTREAAPNIANLAALIGEPARAAMLWSLMGGQTRPAGELARIAGASPQAASAHLAKLADGGLLHVEPQGRRRFYRLSGPQAAAAVESLAALATVVDQGARVVSLVPQPLRHARRCFGHLAGRRGVELHDALIDRGWIDVDGGGYAVSRHGLAELLDLGVPMSQLKAGRRGLVFPCLDWSERRPHLGGALARGLLDLFIAKGWLRQAPDSRRLEESMTGRERLDHLCRPDRLSSHGTPRPA